MGEEPCTASGGVAAPSPGVVVCLHGGRTIRVGRQFDGATFLRVVALLEREADDVESAIAVAVKLSEEVGEHAALLSE